MMNVMNGFRLAADFVCRNFFPEILLARVNVHIRMAQTLARSARCPSPMT